MYLGFGRADTSRHDDGLRQPLGRPACDIPALVVPAGMDHEDPTTVLASTSGGPTDVAGRVVRVGGRGWAVVSIIIGRPDTRAGVGSPASLPRDSAARRDNQLATGEVHNPRAGDTVHASYDFTATGRYPVFYVYTGPAAADCTNEESVTMMARLGVVDVHT